MQEEHHDKEARREGPEEVPQVYTVQKDLTGWQFSRRDFLATAGTAAAAAVAGAAAGCTPATPMPTPTATPRPTATPTATPQPTLSPEEKAKACKDVIAHNNIVSDLVASPDGKLLISSGDWTIKLWSLPEGALLKTLEGGVDALAVSPDGKLLASACKDKTIKLWSLPEGALLKTLEGHGHYVSTLAVSPDGKLLASGSWDWTIKLWSLPEGALLKTLKGHKDLVSALAVSPDGKLLASASKDQTIKLWSLPEGEFVSCLMDLTVNKSDVKGSTYKVGTTEYTLPCGAPIPPGAVCVCNCVAAKAPTCSCVGDITHYWHPN